MGKFPAYGKPKSGASFSSIGTGFCLGKSLEQLRQEVLRNTVTLIGNRNTYKTGD